MPSMNLFYNQIDIVKENGYTLNDILEMPYYKFEISIERINERNEERTKEEQKQNKEMSNNQQNMPSFKVPKFNVPKLR